jgi:quercetin dioxygenase-like cupin family protein
MRQLFVLLILSLIIILGNSMAQNKIERKELLLVPIGSRTISTVDIKEVTMPPGQKGAYHNHPCPVVGHIVSGSVLFQVEGDSVKVLKAGEAFYEPAQKPIVHFDNASDTEPLIFIAYYLLNGEKDLIKLLPEKSSK